MDSKQQELIFQINEAIKSGIITVKELIKLLPKQSKEEQKAYRNAWYQKNKEQVILRVKKNIKLKKEKKAESDVYAKRAVESVGPK